MTVPTKRWKSRQYTEKDESKLTINEIGREKKTTVMNFKVPHSLVTGIGEHHEKFKICGFGGRFVSV